MRHLHHGQHRSAEEIVNIEQLAQAGGLGLDYVVRQHHREGLVAHQFHGAEHGVAQAQRLLLTHVGDVDHVGDAVDDGEQLFFAARFEQVFQLEADVEMIFDGGLAAAGHDDDVLDSGMHRFLDAVLNDGFVHDAAASPSAAPWWRGETGCRARRREKQLFALWLASFNSLVPESVIRKSANCFSSLPVLCIGTWENTQWHTL